MTNEQIADFLSSAREKNQTLSLDDSIIVLRELQIARTALENLIGTPQHGINHAALRPLRHNPFPRVPIKSASFTPRGTLLTNKKIDLLVRSGHYGSERQQAALSHDKEAKPSREVKKAHATNGGFSTFLAKFTKVS